MMRSRLFACVATPVLAVSLLLPSAALASPYARSVPMLGMQDPGGESLAQPVPGQTPVAPVNTQVQAPGAQTQTTPSTDVAGPQSQSQTLNVPDTPGASASPGGVVMQPQIQVLVQPQIQVQAQPEGNASPTSSADITTTADADTDTDVDVVPTVSTKTPPVYVAPPHHRYPHTRYAPPPPPPRIVTRVVSRPSHAAPAPIKRPPPPRKGLMISGWILFGVSYLITASNAADLYDRCPNMKSPGRCRNLAENMFIPVVGPFLGMKQARFATDDFSLAASGSLQGLGLIMGIIGTVQYHRDKHRNRVLNEYGVRVTKNTSVNAGSSRMGGGEVTLTARF